MGRNLQNFSWQLASLSEQRRAVGHKMVVCVTYYFEVARGVDQIQFIFSINLILVGSLRIQVV